MADAITATALTAGVVSHFLYEELRTLAHAGIKALAPGAFRGSSALLKEADREFDEIKRRILDEYPRIKTLEIFLSPEKTMHRGVLRPLFANLFLGQPLDRQALINTFRSCLAKGEQIDAGNIGDVPINHIIDNIIDTSKSVYLGNPKTAPYILATAVREIKASFKTIQQMNERIELAFATLDNSLDDERAVFCKDYLRHLKDYLRDIVINGLDAVTKKERLRHIIQEAFLPLTIDHAMDVGSGEQIDAAWRGNAFEVTRIAPRIIIRGPAGCGKTTLLQWYIANCDPFSHENDSGLTIFPIYIALRRLDSLNLTDWSIANVVYTTLGSEILRKRFPSGLFEYLDRKQVQYSFLLDGVDEISESNRDKFWQFIDNILRTNPQARVIITSRNLTAVHLSNGQYRDDIYQSADTFRSATVQWRPPSGFLEFVVLPLTNEEVAGFIDKWHIGADEKLLPVGQQEEILTYPRNLKREIFRPENKAALELCRTPLLCSLVCMVFFLREGNLPRNKRALYEMATKLLIETRDEHRGISVPARFQGFSGSRRLEVLRRVALLMQEGVDPHQQDQLIEIPKDTVLKFVSAWLGDNRVGELDAEEIVNFLIERCSIIREPVANRVDFIHRSFMEYLAANEAVVVRSPYELRNRVINDQWMSTLQFCMDTETGGVYFAGHLVSEMVSFLNERPKTKRNENENRSYYLRVASLVGHASEYPESFKAALFDLASHVLPPRSLSEIRDCIGLPYAVLRDPLKYEVVRPLGEDAIIFSGLLLAQHKDERCGNILLTGYERHADKGLIYEINRSGKIGVENHFALIRRVENRSYQYMVFYRADEFVARSLVNLKAREIGIRFPLNAPTFVGWDHLRRCRDVTLINARRSDWMKIQKSYKTWRFETCTILELESCFDFDFEVLTELFPRLKYIIIDDCYTMNLDGIEKCRELEVVEFRNILRPIGITKAPSRLKEIIFTNCGQHRVAKDLRDRGVEITVRYQVRGEEPAPAIAG